MDDGRTIETKCPNCGFVHGPFGNTLCTYRDPTPNKTVELSNEPKQAVNLTLLGDLLGEAMDETSEGFQRLAQVEAKVEHLNSWVDNELRAVVDNALEVVKSLGERLDKIEQLLNKDVER